MRGDRVKAVLLDMGGVLVPDAGTYSLVSRNRTLIHALSALGDRRQIHRRGGRAVQRSQVVLGLVVAEEAGRIGVLQQLQPLAVQLAQWLGATFEVVEDPEAEHGVALTLD